VRWDPWEVQEIEANGPGHQAISCVSPHQGAEHLRGRVVELHCDLTMGLIVLGQRKLSTEQELLAPNDSPIKTVDVRGRMHKSQNTQGQIQHTAALVLGFTVGEFFF
jgi:hypothetical protein